MFIIIRKKNRLLNPKAIVSYYTIGLINSIRRYGFLLFYPSLINQLNFPKFFKSHNGNVIIITGNLPKYRQKIFMRTMAFFLGMVFIMEAMAFKLSSKNFAVNKQT